MSQKKHILKAIKGKSWCFIYSQSLRWILSRIYYFWHVLCSERFHRDRGDASVNIYQSARLASQYPARQLAGSPGEPEPASDCWDVPVTNLDKPLIAWSSHNTGAGAGVIIPRSVCLCPPPRLEIWCPGHPMAAHLSAVGAGCRVWHEAPGADVSSICSCLDSPVGYQCNVVTRCGRAVTFLSLSIIG